MHTKDSPVKKLWQYILYLKNEKGLHFWVIYDPMGNMSLFYVFRGIDQTVLYSVKISLTFSSHR